LHGTDHIVESGPKKTENHHTSVVKNHHSRNYSRVVSVYDMAARFRFLHDDFIDKRVLLGGDELSVFEVTDKHVFLAPTDAKQTVTRRNCERVSSLDAVCRHVRALMHDEKGYKKTRLADDVKQIVKKTLDLKRDFEHRKRSATIIEGQLKRKLYHLQAALTSTSNRKQIVAHSCRNARIVSGRCLL
jgi:hypothetical protein